MVEIRELRPGDAEACDAIVLSLPYHFGNADGRRQCAEAVRAQPGLVAVEKGRVVGFLTVTLHFEEAAEITWMAVHADSRRHGFGTLLMDELAARLTREGRRVLVALTVSPSDGPDEVDDGYQATRAFYRSAGFVMARDLRGLWGDGDTPVLMIRPL